MRYKAYKILRFFYNCQAKRAWEIIKVWETEGFPYWMRERLEPGFFLPGCGPYNGPKR